jgi:hypothetical protein
MIRKFFTSKKNTVAGRITRPSVGCSIGKKAAFTHGLLIEIDSLVDS